MSALHQAIEYSALGWVKPELDETLRLAQVEIEGFIEDPSDSSRMRVCAELLHQVQGTLRMVELYAPAMVAEEMEHLAHALEQGRTEDRENACSALIRGVVQLPDYLERLQSGHKEISIVLLPVLNELRAARGETGLSESVLFVPDLNRALPASLPRSSGAVRASEVTPYLVRLRDARISRSKPCWPAPTTTTSGACSGSARWWPPRCKSARLRPAPACAKPSPAWNAKRAGRSKTTVSACRVRKPRSNRPVSCCITSPTATPTTPRC
jgi:chemosensory pili system protein ChpA (sensor histidine kinase/response regulator)